jgi:hypothetical protein
MYDFTKTCQYLEVVEFLEEERMELIQLNFLVLRESLISK